jgi:hypothetical protein
VITVQTDLHYYFKMFKVCLLKALNISKGMEEEQSEEVNLPINWFLIKNSTKALKTVEI